MTSLSTSLQLQAPIVQAPMAGAQGAALAAAVCEAGALGSVPAAMHTPDSLDAELQALRALTQRPFNLNFFCHRPPTPDEAALARWHAALAPHYQALGLDPAQMPSGAGRAPFGPEHLPLIERHRPAVLSFHFGLPEAALLARARALGCQIWSSATTVAEARWLQAHGADVIIAQGLEAGGHRGMFLSDDLSTQLGTLALLPQVLAAVDRPVLAAGGVADAAGVRAMRALGASGVQIGTAWLCTPEASTSALHRAALRSSAAEHTALTRLFSGRPARGIVNGLMRAFDPMDPLAPAFPLAGAALGPLRSAAEAQGRTDYTPLWSGQNASACQDLPAAELAARFIAAWQAGA